MNNVGPKIDLLPTPGPHPPITSYFKTMVGSGLTQNQSKIASGKQIWPWISKFYVKALCRFSTNNSAWWKTLFWWFHCITNHNPSQWPKGQGHRSRARSKLLKAHGERLMAGPSVQRIIFKEKTIPKEEYFSIKNFSFPIFFIFLFSILSSQ